MRRSTAVLLSVIAVPVAPAVHAAHAHVHGQATLEVAMDGSTLTVMLTSPLDSLAGFEQSPRTAQQQDLVRRMARTLRQADQLFGLPADARCGAPRIELVSPAIPSHLLAADGMTAQPPGKPAARSGAHAELEAQYVWTCERSERVSGIDVHLFARFPHLNRIDARVLAGAKQRSARLTEKSSRLVW